MTSYFPIIDEKGLFIYAKLALIGHGHLFVVNVKRSDVHPSVKKPVLI